MGAEEIGSSAGPKLPTSVSADAYKDVRALARGLKVIEAIGTLGWVKPGALSNYTGIDRTTVYRLLSTLADSGYVTRRDEDGAVNLSWKLLQITSNLRGDDLLGQIVTKHLSRLTEIIKWPSDFAMLSGGELQIKVSTHNMSPMSLHRGMIGRGRPLLRSALGKAMLSAMSEEELRETLNITRRLEGQDAKDARSQIMVRRVLEEVRTKGYASAMGTTEANISAIALPISTARGVLGAINIIFFRSALTTEEAAKSYLADLRRCADAISEEMSEAIAKVA
ncbi:hypothetical protein AA2016_6615 (plasmid) [Aminobacter aminovorans]|nr:hypothetical protein AA2016_6615 [Aminobacter aminovorans]